GNPGSRPCSLESRQRFTELRLARNAIDTFTAAPVGAFIEGSSEVVHGRLDCLSFPGLDFSRFEIGYGLAVAVSPACNNAVGAVHGFDTARNDRLRAPRRRQIIFLLLFHRIPSSL